MKVLESPEELAAEDKLRRHVELCWGIKTVKLAMEDRIDLMIISSNYTVAGFIELKCRTCRFGQYPNYMLSYNKYLFGSEWARQYDVSFLLVVEFTNGIYWTNLSELKNPILGKGGSGEQMARGAAEQIIHIPWNRFKKIEQRN